ncbi:MAG: hypothetical protein JWR60_855 [Polaromonas sp.]|nr:hypothetical protein [Polaromonas sp.]
MAWPGAASFAEPKPVRTVWAQKPEYFHKNCLSRNNTVRKQLLNL